MTNEPEHSSSDLVTQTYLRLRSLIVAGRLAPGTRIMEPELAERLGVSRTPIRSALHRLFQEGLVVASPGGKHRRLSVAPLTEADARDLLNLIGALEGLTAAAAARLEQRSRARMVGEMRRVNDEIAHTLADTPQPEQLFTLHTQFHQCHVEATDAPRLRTLHGTIKPQAERYRRLYAHAVATGFRDEVDEHQIIIDAIERGDVSIARQAVEENWDNAAERLCRVIAQSGEQGAW